MSETNDNIQHIDAASAVATVPEGMSRVAIDGEAAKEILPAAALFGMSFEAMGQEWAKRFGGRQALGMVVAAVAEAFTGELLLGGATEDQAQAMADQLREMIRQLIPARIEAAKRAIARAEMKAAGLDPDKPVDPSKLN